MFGKMLRNDCRYVYHHRRSSVKEESMRNRRAARAALAGGACVAAIACVGVPLASGSGEDVKVAAENPAPGTPIYLNRRYSYAERAADLVSRMTPAEKASQLISSQAPAI